MSNGRKLSVLLLLLVAIATIALASCGHSHSFSKWEITKEATCNSEGQQVRTCDSCGFSEYSAIPMIAQHKEEIDPFVSPTCTVDGKTEGTHCSLCHEVLVAQETLTAFGHSYDDGKIVEEATCIQTGTKRYTCTNIDCTYFYEESYVLPSYTPTELYNQSLEYVGEIITYDKNGSELSLATGFVVSSNGRVVTNYHVIDGAYSAKITINGTKYNITKVLAYDSKIDLAVLQINGSNLPYANVCKKTVEVGSTVYAIGSSRGMTNTYSQGIITYADREVDGVSHVQHDASITNGNSGGPLINIYGEVIGINTWTMTNSQNLNFAVFVDELDNLIYGQALTMAEFYKKECDVYSKMVDYICQYGTYSSSSNCYVLTLGTTYSSDYSDKYTRRAYYYLDSGNITLDYVINNGEYWAYFIIDNNVDGSYRWYYFDDNDYEMNGTLYASTFDSNTLLGYSYNNIYSSSLRSSVRELASVMVSNLCSRIDYDFSSIGVTAEDLGFYYY